MSASFASVLPPNTFFNPQWTKETKASFAALMSATNLSNVLQNISNLFRPDVTEDIPDEQSYSLCEMDISINMATCSNHIQVHDLISKWLEKGLHRHVQIGNIKVNESMHSINQPLPALF